MRCEWMDMQDLDAIRARSQSWKYGGGPWKTDDGEMRKKTVIRRVMKMYTDDQPQVAKMLEIDDRDYQRERSAEPPKVWTPREGVNGQTAPIAPTPSAAADEPDPNPPNATDPSEIVDDEACKRAEMEIQDSLDAAKTTEEIAAVRARIDENQETLGDNLYIAFLRMWRAKNKEIGVVK